MKGTEEFKKTIQAYLEQRSAEDTMFAESYKKPNKNIDDCITYILNTVKSSGCVGFTDAEIFGMAVHYYDEDDIKVGEKINCDVVVNHKVELTEQELADARTKAMEQAQKEAYEALTKRKQSKPKKTEVVSEQPSLFAL